MLPRAKPLRADGSRSTWRFVCVGRITPFKRQDMLARVLQGLFQERADDFVLTVIGYSSEADLAAFRHEIGRDARIRVLANAGETEVWRELAAADFGLHGHPAEHFGLAVAQMVDAGLPVFVPADGGQTEVAPLPELQYASPAELAARIAAVLDDEALRCRIQAAIAALEGRFSTERFRDRVRAVLCNATAAQTYDPPATAPAFTVPLAHAAAPARSAEAGSPRPAR